MATPDGKLLGGNLCAMNVEDLRRSSLVLLLTEISAVDLSAKTGIAASSITRYKADPAEVGYSRNMSERTARKIETACRKPHGWMDRQHPSGGTDSSGSLAQELSDHVPMIDIPTIEWESIKMPAAAAHRQFKLKIKDDAMASGGPGSLDPGDFAVFDRERRVKPGQNVLLRDGTGYVCIRRYVEVRPGHWQAVPANPNYKTMDSIADSLEIIAAQSGHLYAP